MTYLSCSCEERVATIVLNRPPANALSSHLLQELSQVLSDIESNQEVRVVVIRGEGKFFSAGADIKEFTSISTSQGFGDLATYGQDLFERMETFKKPIIAVIHGAALGGGLELAMACHFRLVTETAKLGLPELQLGLVPGFAGSQRLPRYVGFARAAEMLFTSDAISGIEAVSCRLANHAYANEEELFRQASIMAKRIAQKSPIALKAAIDLLNQTKGSHYYEGVRKEADAFSQVFQTKDAKEGIRAFIEKRPPNFTGE